MPTNGSRMLVASKKHNFSELSSAQGFSRDFPGEIREKSRIAREIRVVWVWKSRYAS